MSVFSLLFQIRWGCWLAWASSTVVHFVLFVHWYFCLSCLSLSLWFMQCQSGQPIISFPLPGPPCRPGGPQSLLLPADVSKKEEAQVSLSVLPLYFTNWCKFWCCGCCGVIHVHRWKIFMFVGLCVYSRCFNTWERDNTRGKYQNTSELNMISKLLHLLSFFMGVAYWRHIYYLSFVLDLSPLP